MIARSAVKNRYIAKVMKSSTAARFGAKTAYAKQSLTPTHGFDRGQLDAHHLEKR